MKIEKVTRENLTLIGPKIAHSWGAFCVVCFTGVAEVVFVPDEDDSVNNACGPFVCSYKNVILDQEAIEEIIRRAAEYYRGIATSSSIQEININEIKEG